MNAFQKPFSVEKTCTNVLTIIDKNGKEICEIVNSNNDLCNEDHTAASLIVNALNKDDP